MQPTDELTIRIGGEAGMGLESGGVGFSRALVRGGLHVFGLPDYHSRIRGGHNFFSVRIARRPLYTHTEPIHLLLALDQETVRRHIGAVVSGRRWPTPLPRHFGSHEVFHLFGVLGGAAFLAAIWQVTTGSAL